MRAVRADVQRYVCGQRQVTRDCFQEGEASRVRIAAIDLYGTRDIAGRNVGVEAVRTDRYLRVLQPRIIIRQHIEMVCDFRISQCPVIDDHLIDQRVGSINIAAAKPTERQVNTSSA